MTGKELARRIGVHWTTVSRWRTGEDPISKLSEVAIRATLDGQGQSRASRPAKGRR